METKQPNWELVGNLGDVNVADYGGFLVYRDTTGVYAPEAEVYEPNEREGTGGTMYRFSLDAPRFKTLTATGRAGREYGSDSDQFGQPRDKGVYWTWYREWFACADKLASAASTSGITPFALLRALASKDPLTRALGYQAVVGNWGLHEFDQYPVTLTEDEAQARYTARSEEAIN